MKRSLLKKSCSYLLAAALVITSAVVPGTQAYGAVTTPKDVKNHWSKPYVEKAIAAGIVAGYSDGNFRPENKVTRAEFCHMLNAVLGNTGTATINMKDVSSKDWFYGDVSKAVAAGYTNGYTDNTFRPNGSITRQEAAVMLSMIVPTYGSAATLTKYPDYKQIADWAKPAMERIVGKGYINVYSNDQKLHPSDKMTRAQAATIVVNLMEKETIVKNVSTVNASGTQLSNTIYSNGLTVPSTAASGSLELNKCVVMGTFSVAGGSTVTLNNSRVAQATLQNSGGVTLAAKGETYVKNTTVANSAVLQTSGLSGNTFGPGFVNVSAIKNARATLSGSFSKVVADGTGANLTLSSGSVADLAVSSGGTGSDVTVQSGATISLITAASPVYLHGTGTVSKFIANASGCTYETKPGTITTGPKVTAPVQSTAKTTITSSPANGASNVNVDTTITIQLGGAMKLYDGTTITDYDVASLVELRRDFVAGSKVTFTGTVDAAKKTLTIEPHTLLANDTDYFLVINKNVMKDTSGNGNAAFQSSFTTGSNTGGSSVSAYLTFTPKNSAKDVSPTAKPQILFTEALLCEDGTSIKTEDLEDIITFRENNAGGSNVRFDAEISSDKMRITVTPRSNLEDGVKYYLAVNSNTLRTASKNTAVPGASVTWTAGSGSSTSSSDYITFSPRNSKTGVATDTEPEISFSEKMECYDGSVINSGALQDIIIFREKSASGKDVSFSASIDSGKRTVTVIPRDTLSTNTTYYLAVDSKAIRTAADGTKVPGASVTWTTGGSGSSSSSDYVSFYPRDGKKGVSCSESLTITFSKRVDFYDGSRIPADRSTELEDCITLEDEYGDDIPFKAYYDTSSYEITIKPTSRLDYDTEYTLSIVKRSFQTRADEETIPAVSSTFTTEE